jgi:hypothetical protein
MKIEELMNSIIYIFSKYSQTQVNKIQLPPLAVRGK